MVTLNSRGDVTEREVLRLARTREDHTQQSLFRFLGPETIRGVSLLGVTPLGEEETQYIYMPAVGRVREISGTSKMGYFMGSDFAYEDLLPENTDRYEYSRGLDDYVDGTECYHITARPATSEVRATSGYEKRELWVTKDDFKIIKIDFFHQGDEPVKTLRLTDFRPIRAGSESQRPNSAQMRHHVNKTTSLFAIKNGKYNLKVNPAYFQQDSMQNWRTEFDTEIYKALE